MQAEDLDTASRLAELLSPLWGTNSGGIKIVNSYWSHTWKYSTFVFFGLNEKSGVKMPVTPAFYSVTDISVFLF